jgi:hypothetical protein
MSSSVAAPLATPVNTEFTQNKGAHLNAPVVGATQDGALKSPDLVNPTDIELIKSMTGEEFSKWKTLYSQANQYQQLLKKGWKEYRQQNLTKPDLDDEENEYNSPDLQKLQENHKKYTGNAAANLKGLVEINSKIQALNKDRGKHDDFGKTSLLIMRPCLEEPAEWDKLQRKLSSRLDSLLKISEHFSLGYSLQKIFNYGTQALDKNFDKAYVQDIGATIKGLNTSIRRLKLDKKKKNLACISVPKFDSGEFEMPEQTMQEDESDESDDVESDDVESDDEDGDVASGDESSDAGSDFTMGDGGRPEAPAAVMEVLTSMGGNGGLLQRVLLSLDERFQISDKELAAKFEEYQEKIEKLTKEAKINCTSKTFQINLGQLKTAIIKTEQGWKAICDDPGNESLQQQYQGLRKETADYISELKLPENFVDALAPSAQGIIDDFKKSQAKPPSSNEDLAKIMERFGGRNGCLSRYLHAMADGKTDKNAERAVLKISGLLNTARSGFDFVKEGLPEMVEATKDLKRLEKQCEADPSFPNMFNLGSTLEKAKQTFPQKNLHEAVIGDIETSRRFLGKTAVPEPKVSPRPLQVTLTPSKKKSTGVIAAPTDDDDPSEILQTRSDPRIVLDVVDGRAIEKAILYVKRIKKTVNMKRTDQMSAVVGWQLLLKFHDKKRQKFPSYEMVPGSKHRGAVEAFLKAGGEELTIGTKEDLQGILFDDVHIIGVVPVGSRNLHKEYYISQRLIIRVRISSLSKRMFFYISTLRGEYGALFDTKKELYMKKSGQVLKTYPSRAEVEKKHKEEVERLNEEKLEIALGIPQSKKRPQPKRQQHEPLAVEDDDEDGEDIESEDDEEGEGVESEDDESEESDEDNDDEDLDGLVLSSLAKFKS